MAATLEQKSSFAIPKLAQDLIAGTIGGWAQVVVGKFSNLSCYCIDH
jgi:solute carrier family 25 carnitine/acylcarnitine transporter 20/29